MQAPQSQDSRTCNWPGRVLTRSLVVLLLLFSVVQFPVPQVSAGTNSARVTAVPSAFRESLNLDLFYQKYLDAGGLPVLGSTNVSDYAMLEARWILLHMLSHRPE